MDRKKPIDGLFSPIERPSRARWVRDGRMSRADDAVSSTRGGRTVAETADRRGGFSPHSSRRVPRVCACRGAPAAAAGHRDAVSEFSVLVCAPLAPVRGRDSATRSGRLQLPWSPAARAASGFVRGRCGHRCNPFGDRSPGAAEPRHLRLHSAAAATASSSAAASPRHHPRPPRLSVCAMAKGDRPTMSSQLDGAGPPTAQTNGRAPSWLARAKMLEGSGRTIRTRPLRGCHPTPQHQITVRGGAPSSPIRAHRCVARRWRCAAADQRAILPVTDRQHWEVTGRARCRGPLGAVTGVNGHLGRHGFTLPTGLSHLSAASLPTDPPTQRQPPGCQPPRALHARTLSSVWARHPHIAVPRHTLPPATSASHAAPNESGFHRSMHASSLGLPNWFIVIG